MLLFLRKKGIQFLFALGAFGVAFSCYAQNVLPDVFVRELETLHIPLDAVGLYIQPLSQNQQTKLPTISLNPTRSFVPASTMKVLTTYGALEILGTDYQWETKVYAKGTIEGDVLKGDLIFKGWGDPKFDTNSFWELLARLRAKGIREIQGDLILDRSLFEQKPFDPAAFDDDPFRPYNAGPDALLLNHKVIDVTFIPNKKEGLVQVSMSPHLNNVVIHPPLLSNARLDCSKIHKGMDFFFSEEEVKFEGHYPMYCGEQTLYVHPATLSNNAFFKSVFSHCWKELGGVFHGSVRDEVVSEEAYLLENWLSPPLAEVVVETNKMSNNVMARNILITVGLKAENGPSSPEKGAYVLKSFLETKGIATQGLVIENGSGLSRIEHVSPQTMAQILMSAYYSPVMPEFMASLPIAGKDGTLKRSMKQTSVVGKAHLKTGAIQDVRAIAGYVLAQSGKYYVVVLMMNHANVNGGNGSRVRDKLLTWIHDNG